MKKSTLIMALALILSLALGVGGTLAYLTDRDSEANIFTVGDVSIDLNETFNPDDAELLPGLDIKKEPTITNTGKNAAWVWATIAFPAALDNDDASKNVVHFNYSRESVADGLWNWQDENGTWRIATEEINGVNYNVYTVLYETALEPGETTAAPVMTKVYMDAHVDIDPKGDVYHVENGVVTGPFWNINDDENPVIYVSAYAIQKEGFETVEEAYAAYNTQWGENGTEWGELDTEIDKAPITVDTLEGLEDAFVNNGEITVAADIDTESLEIPAAADVEMKLEGNTISTDDGLNVYGDAAIENGTLENSSTSYGTFAFEDSNVVIDDVNVVTAGGGVNVRSADASVTFNSGSVTTNSMSTSPRHVFYVVGSLVINDGEFTFSPDNLTRKGSYICAHGPDANVVVNGGTFNKPSTRTAPIQELEGGKVTIYGGKFAFDPSAFVADGYEATKGTDGYWTVAKIAE